jgi:predicted AlkP superfamily pyrophosphatase or phosphodiesterase
MRFDFASKAVAASLVVLSGLLPVSPAFADVYHDSPKLVVIVVIDQFRGDLLDRYRDDLKAPNGFNLFLKRGAYFNDCMYDYGNTKTAPGHATIGTGAYTDGHSIGSNEWWDLSRNTDRVISSVEDERYRLVGTFDDLPAPPPGQPLPTAARIGSSPRNLLASTIGDEVRLATAGESKLYGISLKDRAAILPAGQSANAAYWIDNATGRFVTSTYYMPALPAWVTAFNKGPRVKQAIKDAGLDDTTQFYALVGRTPAANSYELDFAQALIDNEHLGQGKTTDVLTVSLSANDIVGHQFGPDSDSQREMVQTLDRDLDRFFTQLDQKIGLKNVVIAITADHGIAPIPAEAARLGISSATLNLEEFDEKMDAALNAKFSPGANKHYLLPTQELPYMQLDPRPFTTLHVTEQAAEEAFESLAPEIVKSLGAPPQPPNNNTIDEGTRKYADSRLATDANLVFLRSRVELANNKLPNTDFGRIIAHSYTDKFGWYVMMVPQAYQMEYLNGIQTTHFSPWSYDRHVPLGFFGAEFVPGIYREPVAPVDIAVTLASILGVNHPSAAVGRVLTEALKPTQP